MRLLNAEAHDRQILRQLDLFSDTTRAERVAISKLLTWVTVPAGQVLVEEGGRGDQFMIVVEGEVEVRRGGAVIAHLGQGDLVGEMSLLHQSGRGTRNATVTALTDVVLYVGTPSEFRQILDAAPSVAIKIEQTVAARTPIAA